MDRTNSLPPLPAYTPSTPSSLPTSLTTIGSLCNPSSLPLLTYPQLAEKEHVTLGQHRAVINAFFTAIAQRQDDVVDMYMAAGIVTANTTSAHGSTPLLAAISASSHKMVQLLMDHGADVDALGVPTPDASTDSDALRSRVRAAPPSLRTPLMHAAATGNLTVVKLLVDVYGASDAVIAPDGETALHLAVKARRHEVVAYLPVRRGGGWTRWKAHHAVAVDRARRAWAKIRDVLQFLLWDVSKFLLWTVPRFLLWTTPKYVAKRLHKVPRWCARQVRKTPDRVRRAARFTTRVVKALPRKTVEFVGWVKGVAVWVVLALWKLVKATVRVAGSVGKRCVSLVHSLIVAMVTRFRQVTLQDLWNGVKVVLAVLFCGLPALLYGGCKAFVKGMGELVGALVRAATYLPKQFSRIVLAMGSSVVKALEELLVCIHPKMKIRT